jgi:hypothetical protein
MDDFSRYSWLFPIMRKSDAYDIFVKFPSYVERFFNTKIKCVQSGWGGNTHKLSCPYTHQQNGAIERKHRHIVGIGLALLSHASVPIRFWEDAFVTACYLINRMPTNILQNKSSFEIIFKIQPDYKFLKVFGSAYWPNLRPYNANKLQPRSIQCLFLGYTNVTNIFLFKPVEFTSHEM